MCMFYNLVQSLNSMIGFHVGVGRWDWEEGGRHSAQSFSIRLGGRVERCDPIVFHVAHTHLLVSPPPGQMAELPE